MDVQALHRARQGAAWTVSDGRQAAELQQARAEELMDGKDDVYQVHQAFIEELTGVQDGLREARAPCRITGPGEELDGAAAQR